VRDVIVENNVVENSEVGLQFDAGVTGLLEHNNVFKGVVSPVIGPGDGMLRVPIKAMAP
jgi:nitrous oxidase accessory protein NosD